MVEYKKCTCCNGNGKEIDSVKTGKALRKLRESKKVSLRTVARCLCVSAAFLSDLELGRRNWTEDKVKDFLKVL